LVSHRVLDVDDVEVMHLHRHGPGGRHGRSGRRFTLIGPVRRGGRHSRGFGRSGRRSTLIGRVGRHGGRSTLIGRVGGSHGRRLGGFRGRSTLIGHGLLHGRHGRRSTRIGRVGRHGGRSTLIGRVERLRRGGRFGSRGRSTLIGRGRRGFRHGGRFGGRHHGGGRRRRPHPPHPHPPPVTGSTQYLDPALMGTFPFTTVGKVFMTQAGVDYVCSGSSTGGNIVTTAGHCVADSGQFSTNFMFVPEYFNGVAPTGVWVASSLHTTPEWFNSDDFGRDVGFAVVAPMGGFTLEQTVGALTLAQCGLGDAILIAAYPAQTPWNGQQIVTTTGNIVVQDPSVSPPTNGMVSAQTDGSSGGPWIKNFSLGSTAVGTNEICGVVSYSYGNDGLLYSSQFDAYIQTLHDSLLGL